MDSPTRARREEDARRPTIEGPAGDGAFEEAVATAIRRYVERGTALTASASGSDQRGNFSSPGLLWVHADYAAPASSPKARSMATGLVGTPA